MGRSRARDQAKRILVHYFRLLADRTGKPLDSDCISEIEGIVDDLILAAKEEAITETEGRHGRTR